MQNLADSRQTFENPLRTVAVLLMLCCAWPALALKVDAYLSTTSIQLGEPVELTLETDGRPAAYPDLSVLEGDFHILGRRTQSSTSTVNGRTMEQHRLVVTLSPKRAGLLEVPPIRVGEDASQPLQLAVGDGPTDTARPPAQSFQLRPDLLQAKPPAPQPAAEGAGATAVLLEAELEPAEVRVRQQAVLVARVFMASPVMGPRLHDPGISGARLLPLGEDRYQARRAGTDYSVYERRYALFPDVIGLLEIEPLLFEGWIPGSPGAGYVTQGTPVRTESERLTLRVLPAPRLGGHQSWLPARDLTLSEAGPETYRVQAGKPLERVIGLRAEGVMATDLPTPALDAPPGVTEQRARPTQWDERLPEGVVGNRRETIRLTAQEPGFYKLPAVSVDWWDTAAGRWETATLPARELMVTPAAMEPATPGPRSVSRADDSPPSASATGGERVPTPGPVEPTRVGDAGLPTWITVFLALAWLATMAAWWRGRRRTRGARPRHRQADAAPDLAPSSGPADPMREAVAEVRRAYEAGNAGEARDALLAWGRLVLPESPPSNLARLARRCKEPLRGEILTLEQAFFSPKPLHWERQPVWERLVRFEPLPEEEPASFRQKRPLKRKTIGTQAS
jgi:hypothetical protein